MSNKAGSIILLAALVVTIAGHASAQRGPGMGMPNYNPKTETTVTGTVQEVQQRNMMGHLGTHLILKTDSGELMVHLGPADYVTQHQFSFSKGDQVEVTGSQVKMNGKDAFLAREVKKDGKTLTLRNAQGVPEWSAGRRP